VSLFRMIFLTRHGDLRALWRIVAFVVIAGTVGVPLTLLVSEAAPGVVAAQMISAITAVAVATFVLTRFAHRKPFTAVGLAIRPSIWRELGLGLLIGFLMMAGIFLVLVALGYVTLVGRGLTRPVWGRSSSTPPSCSDSGRSLRSSRSAGTCSRR